MSRLSVSVLICSVGMAGALGALGALAKSLLASDEGRLVVLDKQGGRLQVLEIASGTIAISGSTGDGPHEVAIDPAGRTAFVTNYGGQRANNSISVIDLASGRETSRVDLGDLSRPHGIVWHDGALLFTSENRRAVGRLDPASNRVEHFAGTAADGSHMLVVAPDGTALWTANIQSGSVSRIGLADGKVGRTDVVAVGAQAEAIDISPDGREVWVGRNGDGMLSIIAASTRRVVAEIEVGGVPIRLKFTPDGQRVAVSNNRGRELVVVNSATRRIERRVALAGHPIGVVVRPDSRRAWVSLVDRAAVVEIDLDHGTVVQSIAVGGRPDGLAWLP